MTRGRRRLLAAIAVIGALLMLGGSALVVADAQARSDAAQQVIDDLVDYYAQQDGYEVGDQDPLLRSIISDSIANDAPMPRLFTEDSGDYVNASYGAFGGIFSYIPLQRPWSARAIVAPVAIGAVLVATALLVAAAGWTPRRDTAAPAERAASGAPAP